MEGLLYLEDGTILNGIGFGAKSTRVGELVFNTSMVGYQEVLTDPSYAGQVINMTYPLIGNYGISPEAYESDKIHAFGIITKSISMNPSHYSSTDCIDHWMSEMGIPGVTGVDTRYITRKIRNEGTVKCVISTDGITTDQAKDLCNETQLREDYMKSTGVEKFEHKLGYGPRLAILDFGKKNSILRLLNKCDNYIFPYASKAEDILSINPDGILLTNGPGNPEIATEAINEVRKLMDKNIPMLGICMGHQIMALALGGSTFKLKYGHRGGNHGVFDRNSGRSYITSQNHGYAVKAESVILKGLDITHINLNDGTVEGMKHIDQPWFSVQFHPEASPGPQDSSYLLEHFFSLMKGGAK